MLPVTRDTDGHVYVIKNLFPNNIEITMGNKSMLNIEKVIITSSCHKISSFFLLSEGQSI